MGEDVKNLLQKGRNAWSAG